MKNGSILIISNSYEQGKKISEKLKLLRECDTIKIVSYIEAISVLNTTQPSLIIIYCTDSDSVGIVKEIRTINALDKIPILYSAQKFDEEKLLYAFDNGIDDFFFMDDADSVILMRILLTLQKSVLYKQIDVNQEILIAANILDKQSGIYLKDKAPIVLKSFFSQSIEENLEKTVFMYLKPIPIENRRLNMYKIADLLRTVPRANDIIAYGKSSGFYLILYNAGKTGAKAAFDRISLKLSAECNIYACCAEITSSFEEMEPVLYNSVKEQIQNNQNYNYLYEIAFNETAKAMDIKDENGKKYKDFKKEFLKSFEQIVAPVFYREQVANAEKYKDAEIQYYLNENESKFYIKNNEHCAEMVITYPTYMNVIVDIRHYADENNSRVKRLTFDFEDFSEEKITFLLDDMINEFSSDTLLNRLYTSEEK